MKLPKNINILGSKWKIKRHDLGNECLGLCDTLNRVIYIHKKIPKTLLRSTFLHELFHAVLFEGSLHQTSLNADIEEIIVDLFANTLDKVCRTISIK